VTWNRVLTGGGVETGGWIVTGGEVVIGYGVVTGGREVTGDGAVIEYVYSEDRRGGSVDRNRPLLTGGGNWWGIVTGGGH
jgi:hypothetical protein